MDSLVSAWATSLKVLKTWGCAICGRRGVQEHVWSRTDGVRFMCDWTQQTPKLKCVSSWSSPELAQIARSRHTEDEGQWGRPPHSPSHLHLLQVIGVGHSHGQGHHGVQGEGQAVKKDDPVNGAWGERGRGRWGEGLKRRQGQGVE